MAISIPFLYLFIVLKTSSLGDSLAPFRTADFRAGSFFLAAPLAVAGEGTPGELTDQIETSAARNNSNAGSADAQDRPLTSLAFIPPDVLDGAIQLKELRPTIDQLYYKPAGGLSYQDERGWRGYFGTGMQMNQKLVVYERIVSDLTARGIQPAYISVSNQEKPYYGSGVVPEVVPDTEIEPTS